MKCRVSSRCISLNPGISGDEVLKIGKISSITLGKCLGAAEFFWIGSTLLVAGVVGRISGITPDDVAAIGACEKTGSKGESMYLYTQC